jgi:uncharacterized protein YoxC
MFTIEDINDFLLYSIGILACLAGIVVIIFVVTSNNRISEKLTMIDGTTFVMSDKVDRTQYNTEQILNGINSIKDSVQGIELDSRQCVQEIYKLQPSRLTAKDILNADSSYMLTNGVKVVTAVCNEGKCVYDNGGGII